jgi:hypothetical protein
MMISGKEVQEDKQIEVLLIDREIKPLELEEFKVPAIYLCVVDEPKQLGQEIAIQPTAIQVTATTASVAPYQPPLIGVSSYVLCIHPTSEHELFSKNSLNTFSSPYPITGQSTQ